MPWEALSQFEHNGDLVEHKMALVMAVIAYSEMTPTKKARITALRCAEPMPHPSQKGCQTYFLNSRQIEGVVAEARLALKDAGR